MIRWIFSLLLMSCLACGSSQSTPQSTASPAPQTSRQPVQQSSDSGAVSSAENGNPAVVGEEDLDSSDNGEGREEVGREQEFLPGMETVNQ